MDTLVIRSESQALSNWKLNYDFENAHFICTHTTYSSIVLKPHPMWEIVLFDVNSKAKVASRISKCDFLRLKCVFLWLKCGFLRLKCDLSGRWGEALVTSPTSLLLPALGKRYVHAISYPSCAINYQCQKQKVGLTVGHGSRKIITHLNTPRWYCICVFRQWSVWKVPPPK